MHCVATKLYQEHLPISFNLYIFHCANKINVKIEYDTMQNGIYGVVYGDS